MIYFLLCNTEILVISPHVITVNGNFNKLDVRTFVRCVFRPNILAKSCKFRLLIDAKGLSNPVEVEALREKVYASLETYTKHKYPDQPGRYSNAHVCSVNTDHIYCSYSILSAFFFSHCLTGLLNFCCVSLPSDPSGSSVWSTYFSLSWLETHP